MSKTMISTCPSCGQKDIDLSKTCLCGFQPDKSYSDEPCANEIKSINDNELQIKGLDYLVKTKNKKPSEEMFIKEVDSWTFTFSHHDKCIYLGTPALKSFRLKLTLNDLEELIEFMYLNTGEEKTLRKLRLSINEISDLVDKVNNKIEEKRSKIPVKLDSDELQEIVDLINIKLKI